MKSHLFPLLMVLSLPACLLGRTAAPAEDQHNLFMFAGVWRGEFDSLPGVDIVISDEAGRHTGAILFYLHTRPDTHSPWTSQPGLPEPMLKIRLDDQTLHFRVIHHRANAPATLHDAPMEFRLRMISPGRAELVNESDGAPVVVMKRSDY